LRDYTIDFTKTDGLTGFESGINGVSFDFALKYDSYVTIQENAQGVQIISDEGVEFTPNSVVPPQGYFPKGYRFKKISNNAVVRMNVFPIKGKI